MRIWEEVRGPRLWSDPDIARMPPPVAVSPVIPGVLQYDPAAFASFKGHDLWVTESTIAGGRRGELIEYPYVPGGTGEDLGRKAWRVSLTCRFFGGDWQQRLSELLFTLESESTAGALRLPNGGVHITARCMTWNLAQSGRRDSATVSLEFTEESHVDAAWLWDPSSSPSRQAAALAAALKAPALGETVEEYLASVGDASMTLADGLMLLNEVHGHVVAAQATLADATTVADVMRDQMLVLLWGSCIDACPDQEAAAAMMAAA